MSANNVNTKRCTKCGQEYPATPEYFHRHKDKLRSHCKSCRTEESRLYASTERGHEVRIKATRKWEATKGREWHKDYAKTEVGKDMFVEAVTKWAKNNPEKVSAVQAVKYAVRIGRIPKATDCLCEKCGRPAVHYHHWSYAREHRLDVIPLCIPCHKGRDGVHRSG